MKLTKAKSDYRDEIRQEFERRRKRNGRYSVRAFARDLGVTHPALLAVMEKKRDFSAKNLDIVAQRLAWPIEKREQAKRLCHERMRNRRDPRPDVLMLGEEGHELLLYPEAATIFQLAKVDGHKADAAWLAAKIKRPRSRVTKALSILQDKGIVAIRDGKIIPLVKGYGFFSNPPFELMKRKEIENLLLSVRAAKTLKSSEHALFMFAFAMKKSDLEKVRRRYQVFWKGIKRDFGAKDGVDTVFVGISHVFPTTY